MDRKNLDAMFKVAGYTGALQFHSDKVENDRVITITARYNYKDTLLSDVMTRISQYLDTKVDASVKQDGNWSNVALWSSATTSRATLVFPSASRQKVKNFSPFLPGAWPQGRPSGLFCV